MNQLAAMGRVQCATCRLPYGEDSILECRECREPLCEYCHGEHACEDEALRLDAEETARRQAAIDDAATALKEAREKLNRAEDAANAAADLLRSVPTAEALAIVELLEQELRSMPLLSRANRLVQELTP